MIIYNTNDYTITFEKFLEMISRNRYETRLLKRNKRPTTKLLLKASYKFLSRRRDPKQYK